MINIFIQFFESYTICTVQIIAHTMLLNYTGEYKVILNYTRVYTVILNLNHKTDLLG